MLIAQADADARVIKAEAEAKARRIEAQSRQESGNMLTDQFGRSYALASQQVEFAKVLKAQHLTVLPDNIVAKPIVSSLLNLK